MSGAAVKRSAAAPPVVAHTAREHSLDAFRGVAILLMITDHVCLYAYGFGAGNDILDGLRLTVTRLSMPMFFLLAGHLAWGRDPKLWRVLLVGHLGLLLPLYVTPIDNPNVLVTWAGGVSVLYLAHRFGVHPAIVAGAALALAGNHYAWTDGGYEQSALVGLMALGALLDRRWFRAFGFLPSWVASVGRRPVTIYAGHLIALQTLYLVVMS